MALSANVGPLLGGVLFGVVLFSRGLAWVAFFGGLWLECRSWRFAAAASLFHSGPWLLVACGAFVYFERMQPWWGWFMTGVGGILLPLSFPVIAMLPQLRRSIHDAGNAG
jgi:hypothetical protein